MSTIIDLDENTIETICALCDDAGPTAILDVVALYCERMRDQHADDGAKRTAASWAKAIKVVDKAKARVGDLVAN